MELLEQSPVAGIVIVSVAACLFLLIAEVVKLFHSPSSAKKKSVHEVALEVKAGLWGDDQERIDRLTAAGYNAAEVQAEVNKILKNK